MITRFSHGIDAVYKTLCCGFAAAMCFVLIGCGNTGGGGGAPCGDATITGSGANNTFTMFTATQCDINFDAGTMVLSIDVLERLTTDSSPRVLFTLEDLNAIPMDQTISLAREDDESLAPGIYQEFSGPAADDPDLADGPFWSSMDGNIVFSTDDTGTTTATFDFNADNPRPDNPSTAEGTVRVQGSMTVVAGSGGDTMCGACGSAGIPPLMMIMLGLTLARMRMRRRF